MGVLEWRQNQQKMAKLEQQDLVRVVKHEKQKSRCINTDMTFEVLGSTKLDHKH